MTAATKRVIHQMEHVPQPLPPTHANQTAMPPQSTVDPESTVREWLHKCNAALGAKNVDAFVSLFHDAGWWRDVLNVEFDYNSLKKHEIKPYLSKRQASLPDIEHLTLERPHDVQRVPVAPGIEWIQAYLSYETPTTRGIGFLRLREMDGGDWGAYTLFTRPDAIKGHEEFAAHRRPLGADHSGNVPEDNWLDRREKTLESFMTEDPTVLVVGGGQNGLSLAARLGAVGMRTLVVDKNKRVGDCWRLRYKSLCLHDPVHGDHLPYINYPPQWPMYTPKDKLANWFESYAEAMELNIWTDSGVEPGATYDANSGTWSVDVIRNGKKVRTMHPRYLVLATGFSGRPRIPKNFPMDAFKGTICHSSQHKGAEGWAGKRAVVVGCCNSGHDIAQAFHAVGAETTIVQRSSTYVMSSEHGIPGLLNGYYEEKIPVLDGDTLFTSLPMSMVEEYHIEATKQIAEKDKDTLDGLEKAGFKLNKYPGGLFIKYFRDGGGYYIDIGCSKLIADGKIKIKQGHEITRLTEDGLVFDDGQEIKADIIVLATGYGSMRDTVEDVIGSHVSKKLGPVWGCDKQGEIPGAWRLNGQPGFWLQCGNLFQARTMSKYVAMQIQMQELGLADKNFAGHLDKADPDPRF